MNGEIKRLIRETKIVYQVKKKKFITRKSVEIWAGFAKQERGNILYQVRDYVKENIIIVRYSNFFLAFCKEKNKINK